MFKPGGEELETASAPVLGVRLQSIVYSNFTFDWVRYPVYECLWFSYLLAFFTSSMQFLNVTTGVLKEKVSKTDQYQQTVRV